MDSVSQPNKTYSYLITAGHICCDMNQSTVPALLPFLVMQRGIDYTSAAGLMFASSFLSSLVQPLLGMVADRRQMPWQMAVGILMTGFGIASVGFLDSYWGIFAAIMLAGFGSALFHPEGARMANCVSGEKKGRGMSNFSVGGSLGFVIGPIVATFSVSTWGLRGIAVVLIPTLATSAVLFAMQEKFMQLSGMVQREAKEKAAVSGQKDDWLAFLRFCVTIFARSIMHNGFHTLIPLYWISVLLQSQSRGSLMVTVMACAGTVGMFFGGRLADRFGFRRVIRIAQAIVFPLILLMLISKNVWAATAFVMLFMMTSNLAHSPAVVLGQKYLPNHLGLASGVTFGLAISMGGIFSPLLGNIADNHGLTAALYVVSGIALAAFLGSLLLKEPRTETRAERSVEKT